MSLTLHTTLGPIKLSLYTSDYPLLASNFLALAASGAYSSTKFHRIVPGFICQGGDPTGTGKGGESIFGGLFEDEIPVYLKAQQVSGESSVSTGVPSHLKFDRRGQLAMATKGPNTNGSQFFITFSPCPHLNNVNIVFGSVIHGFETLDAIERVEVDAKYRPQSEILIDRIEIHANPMA